LFSGRSQALKQELLGQMGERMGREHYGEERQDCWTTGARQAKVAIHKN
jgi:hypothetical protein